jgi:WD40 repeat protein
MKIQVLRIVSVSLILATTGAWCGAAPGPAHLSEIATLAVGNRSHISSLTFSPDGKTLFAEVIVSIRGPRTIWIWDVASRKHIGTFEPTPEKGDVLSRIVWSPDTKTVACLCGDSSIELWDVASRKRTGSLQEYAKVSWMVFSPDSKTLSVAVEIDKMRSRFDLRIRDVEKRTRVRSWEARSPLPVSAPSSINQPVLLATDLRRNRPGKPSEFLPYVLVDAFTGETVHTCEAESKYGVLHCFAVNRTVTMMAATDARSTVWLWDKKSSKSIASFKHPPATNLYGLFHPGGKILALVCEDGGACSVLLYEVPSGKILAELKRPDVDFPLAFSADGQLLATGTSRGIQFRGIKLWSIPEKWRKEK